ncbi:MAG: translation elongation factor 4 [Candidatus Jorgensenbacteria bacterium]|nr:translation elongation factor 4 [Candidatus Jorgensenbacteria bacterium]
MSNIRNFCIIAHIDHGKSTLADRFLEVTGTVEARRMKAQYLDQLELERERGITIKMAPVRMKYGEYTLNLIDTPGHSDFSYEVSRALHAVEGGILLVDATQGVQAQTLANLLMAKKEGLTLVGAVNKVDLVLRDAHGTERVEVIKRDVAKLLGCTPQEIFSVSGKTGEGVEGLLKAVIEKVPPPKVSNGSATRALIFDSFYDDHKGIIASVRVFEGTLAKGDTVRLLATGASAQAKEVGFFAPELTVGNNPLTEGMIGYVATGVREPHDVRIGDTITVVKPGTALPKALPGYEEARPVVFVSFYPEDADEHELLTKALEKLKLNDAALSIKPDQNEMLGRGYQMGFLGRLHFEIATERLRREFNVRVITTFPSVAYRVKVKEKWEVIQSAENFPEDAKGVEEPTVELLILLPVSELGDVLSLQKKFRMTDVHTTIVEDRAEITAVMPLAELVSDFDDQLKSATKGYASFSYRHGEYQSADVVKVDILVASARVPGLSRFLPRAVFEREARTMLARLKALLPRQQFAQALQASAEGRIIARDDIQALKKDVTGYLYGGDRTRKMKLWKKQKRGKERLKERGEVSISPSVFKELLKK